MTFSINKTSVNWFNFMAKVRALFIVGEWPNGQIPDMWKQQQQHSRENGTNENFQ
jgi:hypothetical protein